MNTLFCKSPAQATPPAQVPAYFQTIATALYNYLKRALVQYIYCIYLFLYLFLAKRRRLDTNWTSLIDLLSSNTTNPSIMTWYVL